MIERANRYGAKTGESETAGCSNVPYAVLTVHTRVTPSFPGWVAVIFPSGHMPRGVKSCSNHTISLTLREDVALFHFCRRSKVGKYSFKNRFQKWFATFWTSFQELKDSGLSVSSKTMGGMFANGRCRRKWFGVRCSSFSGWSLTWVSGREFNNSSVSAKIVMKNSSVNFWDPKEITIPTQ